MKQPSRKPTDAELAILRILWTRGPSTVRDVAAAMGREGTDTTVLKLLQMMTDKAPYGDGNDLYYQCIDLVLSDEGDVDPNPKGDGDDAGCGCRGAVTGGSWWLLALVLVAHRRRR